MVEQNAIAITMLIAVFCVGLFVGAALEARRWRSKANSYMRIESAGKLYYVREESTLKTL